MTPKENLRVHVKQIERSRDHPGMVAVWLYPGACPGSNQPQSPYFILPIGHSFLIQMRQKETAIYSASYGRYEFFQEGKTIGEYWRRTDGGYGVRVIHPVERDMSPLTLRQYRHRHNLRIQRLSVQHAIRVTRKDESVLLPCPVGRSARYQFLSLVEEYLNLVRYPNYTLWAEKHKGMMLSTTPRQRYAQMCSAVNSLLTVLDEDAAVDARRLPRPDDLLNAQQDEETDD